MERIFICPAPIRRMPFITASANTYQAWLETTAHRRKLKSMRMSPTSSAAAENNPIPAKTASSLPSPKVATYDLKPEMSALEVTDKLKLQS